MRTLTHAVIRMELLVIVGFPAYGTVQITAVTPSLAPPQVIGTTVTWTVTATDSYPGPLAFQFNVAPPGGALALVKDYNLGAFATRAWTAKPFVWIPTAVEGAYQIQVIAKDFNTGETASKTITYIVNPLVTGTQPITASTGNPLVALFSAPPCPAGSNMRVSFQVSSGSKPAFSKYMHCHPPQTMTFEIAGMYPSTAYQMHSETETGGVITPGSTVAFTTGPLPLNIPFPHYTINIPAGPHTDTADSVLLHNPTKFAGLQNFPNVATDLEGRILWYYQASPSPQVITRPLQNSTLLTIQSGTAWTKVTQTQQFLRQIDLAGNIIKETNMGAIQQQMLALGVSSGSPCSAIPSPPPVGAACIGSFHHDAIQMLPNGYTAVLTDEEKIFPPGTQGDTSGLPVDIVGDMILVLDNNWQVVWYFDAFEHDGGPPQLDINRPAVLGNTCSAAESGCPPMFLLGPGVASAAHDWLHGNSLYYWPQSGDLIWSARNQDWVMKIDYNNGAGTGNILWRMGPCGDFQFNNAYNDPWPWFSAQHEVDFENSGAGPLVLFDNGNTRVSPPSGPGSSTGCKPGVGSGNSRGMALTVDEASLLVSPVLSADLGVYGVSGGSAQLLSDGNYFFMPAVVVVSLTSEHSYFTEILPAPGTDTGAQVLNIQAPEGYRGWQMSSLYNPPIS